LGTFMSFAVTFYTSNCYQRFNAIYCVINWYTSPALSRHVPMACIPWKLNSHWIVSPSTDLRAARPLFPE
jgi:hypothetical protein